MATPHLDSLILIARRHPNVRDLFNRSTGQAITAASENGRWTAQEFVDAFVMGANEIITTKYLEAVQATGSYDIAGNRVAGLFPEIAKTVALSNYTGATKGELLADLPTDFLVTCAAWVRLLLTTSPNPRKRCRITIPSIGDAVLYGPNTELVGPVGHPIGTKFRVAYRGVELTTLGATNANVELTYLRDHKGITQGGADDLLLSSAWDSAVLDRALKILARE